MTYFEKLKDPRWQKKRLEIMERDEWQCQRCGNTEKTLNVHHRRYVTGFEPWEYADADLVTFCEDCHKEITDLKKRIMPLLEFEPWSEAISQLAEICERKRGWGAAAMAIYIVHSGTPTERLFLNEVVDHRYCEAHPIWPQI